MITLYKIEKFYGKQDVLAGVSLQINQGERLGLVGPNGAGKSTILGLVLGMVQPDGGEVFRAKGLEIGYLPQDLLQLSGRTPLALAMEGGSKAVEIEAELDEVHRLLAENPDPEAGEELLERQGRLQSRFEQLGGYDLEARARKVLAGLGFAEEQMDRDLGELSGGWLMRAALAKILLSAPDLVLLDEPTNHLDMESLLWLEGHLISSPASLVLVSHDRAFLDKVATRIVEVEEGQVYSYGGNYSDYIAQREARRKAQQAAYEAQQEQIRTMERFIEKNRARKSSARQVQGRIKALQKMERLKPPPDEDALAFELPKAERSADVVVELEGVEVAYGEKVVYPRLDLVLRRGMRLALLGRNGQGKTTLGKLLAGTLDPTRGRRLIGGRVKAGVFSQHALEDVNPDNDVLTELGTVAGYMPLSRQRALLGAFMFRGDDVFKKVRILSGGERSRLVLAKLLLSSPNFLVLDEPTNHLDITSRKVLEMALKQFSGTLVLVTHDRRLINAVADHVGYVEGGRLTVFPGNYNDFARIWRDRLEGLEPAVAPSPPPQAAPAPEPAATDRQESDAPAPAEAQTPLDSKARRRAEAEERNRRYRLLKPLKEKLKKLDGKVESASAELSDLEAEMTSCQDPDLWPKLSREHAEAKTCLEEISSRWEKAALELEELEKSLGEAS